MSSIYRGCWSPIPNGRLCKIKRLYKHEPVVRCIGPLQGDANLRGDQYWRVQFADGQIREVARGHISVIKGAKIREAAAEYAS